jgi:hypothetical protein
MLKEDRSFSWNDTTENNFVEIENAISSALVLANPDFEKDLYTNAIEEVISAIVLQKDDHNE